MILNRHAENYRLLIIFLFGGPRKPDGFFKIESSTHHRWQLKWLRHHVLLVPATLHVPLFDVLFVKPAASKDIKGSQEDTLTFDSLVQVRVNLDLLIGLDHSAESEDERTESVDMIHVLEPAGIGHMEVKWGLNCVKPQKEFVYLVCIIRLLQLIERFVHLIICHTSHLDAHFLVNTILSDLFVLNFSLSSCSTESKKLIYLEAGKPPEDLIHGRQEPIVSFKPHQSKNRFTGHVILEILLVAIIEQY